MTDANSLEATLKNQQWVGGKTPTAADKNAFEALSKAGMVDAETHPNTFAWFALCAMFINKVLASWPTAYNTLRWDHSAEEIVSLSEDFIKDKTAVIDSVINLKDPLTFKNTIEPIVKHEYAYCWKYNNINF